MPPIAIGMFDQYVSAQVLDKYPQLYRLGQSDSFYNHKIFLGWIFNSLFHSFGIFGGWYLFIGEGDIMSRGLVIDNWAFGSMVYFTVLFTVLIKHCLIADNYNRFTAIAFFGSLIVYFIVFPTVSSLLILVCICWAKNRVVSGIVQSFSNCFPYSKFLVWGSLSSSFAKPEGYRLEIQQALVQTKRISYFAGNSKA